MFDEIDRQIVILLQEDTRLSNAAIAERVGLTASTVFERVKKLERKGIIRHYTAVVNPAALGKPITAFIRLVVGTAADEQYTAAKENFVAACLAEPDVLECHSVAGEDCYVLKVRVATPQALERLLERLRSHAVVTRSTTNIVLTTFKESARVEPAVVE
jgi:Lrp/AsnC family transcriptional regulator, leucine-responsive regulatory protein